jgi:hypothetical protein
MKSFAAVVEKCADTGLYRVCPWVRGRTFAERFTRGVETESGGGGAFLEAELVGTQMIQVGYIADGDAPGPEAERGRELDRRSRPSQRGPSASRSGVL